MRLSNKAAEFSITSSADVTVENDDVDFRDSKAAAGLVDLIGAELSGMDIDDRSHSAVIRFAEGKEVRAWWPDKIFDNLWIVRQENSENWWVLG